MVTSHPYQRSPLVHLRHFQSQRAKWEMLRSRPRILLKNLKELSNYLSKSVSRSHPEVNNRLKKIPRSTLQMFQRQRLLSNRRPPCWNNSVAYKLQLKVHQPGADINIIKKRNHQRMKYKLANQILIKRNRCSRPGN